ncbi:unnamed protein product [Caenorhabditis angaria]|uniref:G-protein coupled receptors family 1 profile domain-containing protein n=1 Tax=Caenorhabditis angaria TaxID=860376 RepID=A0A9P1IYF0_9PELO|nr:unnamed protein product [Caenorhabditis angaria]
MDFVDIIASFLLFTIGIIGVFLNTLIVYIFIYEKSHQTAFNLICTARAANNAIVLTTTFLLIFFVVATLPSSPYPQWFEFLCISFGISLYLVNEYTSIIIALNRFIALFAPTFYSKYCGIKITAFLLLLLYIYRLFETVSELSSYIPRKCYTIFGKEKLSYKLIYADTPCVNTDDNYSEFTNIIYLILFLFVSVLFLNIATFIRIAIFIFNRKSMDQNSKNRMKKNAILFFQTIIQDALVLIDMFFTFKLGYPNKPKIWSFIHTILVWELIHTMDGLIMILFNERISVIKNRLFSQPTVIVQPTSKSDFSQK